MKEIYHPEQLRMLPDYERNEMLYDGGSNLDGGWGVGLPGRNAAGQGVAGRRLSARTRSTRSLSGSSNLYKYLTKHPYESEEQFRIRCHRAAYRNYAAPTVDLFASSVLAGVDRSGLSSIKALLPTLRDCDRAGHRPEQFFKNVITRAAAVGARFVLVDLPRLPENSAPICTREDAQRHGITPYFVDIPAQNLLSWRLGADRKLDFIVYLEEGEEMPGPFEQARLLRYLNVWERGPEGVFWQRYLSEGGSNYTLDECGDLPHLDEIPLVSFLYEAEGAMTGRSVTDDICSLILRVFNADSELDKMLFDAAVPLTYAVGVSPDEVAEAVRASSNLWVFRDPESAVRIVEPSGQSFAAKRQQIMDDIDSIREISLRQTRPRGAGVESAESRRLDSVQVSSQIAEFARNAAASENRCWQIAARLAGADSPEIESINIRYNEHFDPESLKAELTRTFLELRRNQDISRNAMLRQIGLDEHEIGRINEEIEKERP